MRIAVTDANIFIDLHYLAWLPRLVELDLEIHTTNYVLDELNAEQVAALIALRNQRQLLVYTLSDEQLILLASTPFPHTLSEADKSVLWYAQNLPDPAIIILSSDKPMRRWCEEHQLEVHGMLWIFDRLLAKKMFSAADLAAALLALMRFNPRLPQQECTDRLERWK